MRAPGVLVAAGLLALLAGCATAAGPAKPLSLAEPVSVAVRTPKTSGGELTPSIAEIVATSLCLGLTERGGEQVHCRTEADNRQLAELTARRIQLAGCAEATGCGDDTMRNLTAPWAVIGRLVDTGGRIHLTASLVHVEDDTVAGTVEAQVKVLDDLPDAARDAGRRLVETLAR